MFSEYTCAHRNIKTCGKKRRFTPGAAAFAALSFLFCTAFPLYAEETDFEDSGISGINIDIGGKIETVHGVRLQKPFDYAVSRNFINLFMQVNAGDSSAKISAAGEYNYRNAGRTGFRLQEAYYRYAGNIFELTAGRQIIAWGQADGFALTNVFTARDNSEFIATHNEISELGTDAVKIKFLHDIFTFEAVAVPFFTPDKLPLFSFEDGAEQRVFTLDLPQTKTLPFSPVPVKLYYSKREAYMPRKFIDTEAGARLSFFLPAMDFSFSGFYGWNKTPYYERTGTLALPPGKADIVLHEKHARIAMAGFDAAVPAGDVIIRFETAWIGGRYFEPKEPIDGKKTFANIQSGNNNIIFNAPLRKNQLLMLAGIDWTRGPWFLSAQYFEDLVPDHRNELERSLHKGAVSLNISKTFLRETLKLAARGVIGVNYGDTFSTYSLDYALTDNLHLACGADVYTKGHDGKGDLGKMNKLTAAWIKGSYTFSR